MPERQINALPVARIDFESCKALKAAVSTDENRPVLQYVMVREGFAEATDGRVLCRVPLTDDTGEEFSLPLAIRGNRSLIHRAVLGHVRSGHSLEIDMSTGECWVVGKDEEEGYPIELPRADVEIEGRRYPNTDRVVPRPTDSHRTLQIGAAVLKAMLAFAGSGKDSGRLHLLIPPEGDNNFVDRAVLFQRPRFGKPARSGVLMPMHVLNGFESIGGDAETAKKAVDDAQQSIPGIFDDEEETGEGDGAS